MLQARLGVSRVTDLLVEHLRRQDAQDVDETIWYLCSVSERHTRVASAASAMSAENKGELDAGTR